MWYPEKKSRTGGSAGSAGQLLKGREHPAMGFRLSFGGQHRPQQIFEQRKVGTETRLEEWSSDPIVSDPGGGVRGERPLGA